MEKTIRSLTECMLSVSGVDDPEKLSITYVVNEGGFVNQSFPRSAPCRGAWRVSELELLEQRGEWEIQGGFGFPHSHFGHRLDGGDQAPYPPITVISCVPWTKR